MTTTWDLRLEFNRKIEVLKRVQREMMALKNPTAYLEFLSESLTDRTNQAENGLSGLTDKVEYLHKINKEYKKIKENTGMCYTIKRSSLSIMQIDKKEESQINSIDQTFKKILEENLPTPREESLSFHYDGSVPLLLKQLHHHLSPGVCLPSAVWHMHPLKVPTRHSLPFCLLLLSYLSSSCLFPVFSASLSVCLPVLHVPPTT